MTTIDIACASDDRYIAHTAAMLHSVRWHATTELLRVHFLAGADLTRAQRSRFGRMAGELGVEVRWVEIPETLLKGLPGRDYLSRVVWHRVFMPQLLELDRILYLDSDVIAIDSIAPLWAIDIGDNYFGAVTNVVPEYFSERAVELGLPGPASYFNLGVALWNLSRMRQERFTEDVLDYVGANLAKLRWLEQDAINALYWKRRQALHPRWNCQNGIYYRSWGIGLLDPVEVEEALRAPALLHFEGGTFAKPWHLLSMHPLRDRYCFHRRQTPWPFWLPDGISARNLVKRYMPAPVVAWLRHAVRGTSAP